jgi:CheY-like chemotaxis protein
MLMHELATNAFRYGALSVASGHVEVMWSTLPTGAIELRWTEYGGPPVAPPSEPGFGSTLIHQIVQNQLSGSFKPAWNRAGYQCVIQLPETVLQASQDGPRKRIIGNDSESLIRKAAEAPAQDIEEGGTLLIVEDEPLLAMQLSQSLSDFGWSIVGVAGSVEDANRILAEKRRPDAAILDVDLGGVPVFPLARSLRRSGIPFVFCTGYEDLDYTREFADYTTVRKPATVLQIVRALRDVVRNVSAQTVVEPGR